MKLCAEPISRAAFEPFGTLLPRPQDCGRTFISELVESNDPAARLTVSLYVTDPTTLPVIVPKMERHRHSAQMFLPLAVERYLVTVAEDAGGAPHPETLRAFVVPGDVGIVYPIDRWHCPIRVLDHRGSLVGLMAMSGTARDEEWSELPAPLEIALA